VPYPKTQSHEAGSKKRLSKGCWQAFAVKLLSIEYSKTVEVSRQTTKDVSNERELQGEGVVVLVRHSGFRGGKGPLKVRSREDDQWREDSRGLGRCGDPSKRNEEDSSLKADLRVWHCQKKNWKKSKG